MKGGDFMSIYLPDFVLEAISLLNEANYEVYVVGGSIRNALLDLPVFDYDLTTSATPEEMKQVFSSYKIIETGIKHGTLTILIDNQPLEITTYRHELGYEDHRHPSQVEFSRHLKDDLARRDFTINALAYHPEKGIVDYFDGLTDLNNHVIRAINDPYIRFDEDALRILRALRFASTLNFTIEPLTKQALHDTKQLLSFVSKERIQTEFTKLIVGDGVFDVLNEFHDVLGIIMPEIIPIINCPHENPHHIYSIYEHTLHVVEKVNPSITLRMAALLHDIGKPATKTYDTMLIAHYKGHSEKSLEMASNILHRLRFSKNQIKDILVLIKYHDDYLRLDKIQLKKFLSILGIELTYDLLNLQKADNEAKALRYLKRDEFIVIEKMIDSIIANKECYSLSNLAINGNDLISMNINPTKISSILNECLDKVIEEKMSNSKKELIDYITHNCI